MIGLAKKKKQETIKKRNIAITFMYHFQKLVRGDNSNSI